MNKKLEDKLATLPTKPGVYFHKNKAGETIYIGKAANLRNRVRQYFQNGRISDTKTMVLVNEIADVDWRELDTEADALFLEAELVRRYHPRFNILLRDDKSLQFVRIDYKSDYPTVTMVRRPLDDGAEYFGPYINGFAVKKALRYLRRAFPYAISKSPGQKRTSLYYHLGLDPGLEENKTSLQVYRTNLQKLMQYLRGERVALVKQIERDMKKAAKAKDFEKAVTYRNQLFALQELGRQMLFSDRELMDDALMGLAQLLCLYENKQFETKFSDVDGVQGAGEQRTEMYKASTSKEQSQPATEQSATRAGGAAGSASRQARPLRKLRRIEGFDISHMQGTDTVASMVVFTDGIPDKSAYRKFKMRIAGNDDFAHMAEVIKRRMRDENRKKWGVGDLMLIDGGKGQLSAALAERDREGFASIPMIGLAKRQEEIIVNKNQSLQNVNAVVLIESARRAGAYVSESSEFITIGLPANSQIVKLLQRIRDESHRFAVSYHSTLKRGRVATSMLDEIPGIGPVTRKKLLRKFGSMRAIKNASPSELQAALGPQKGKMLAGYLNKL